MVVEQDGKPSVVLQATLAIAPARFGVSEDTEAEMRDVTLDLIAAEVDRGLRAQPRRAASSARRSTSSSPRYPTPRRPPLSAMPSPTRCSRPRLGRLRHRRLGRGADEARHRPAARAGGAGAVALLANVNALVTAPEIRAAPENLGLLLADARALLNEPGIQEAPGELAAILASVRRVVDQATEAQLVENLSGVLAETKTAVASVGAAADGVPPLLDQIEGVAAELRALPTEDLVASATRLVDNIDAFVKSEGVANVPTSVNDSLAELGLVADLRAGGAVDNVSTRASPRSARSPTTPPAPARRRHPVGHRRRQGRRRERLSGLAAGPRAHGQPDRALEPLEALPSKSS